MLAEKGQYLLIGVVDLLALFGTSQHDLTACKDQKHDLWRVHAENEAWEQFGIVAAHLLVVFN